MLELNSFVRFATRALSLLALITMVSCAATRDADPVMGNTNWLQACDTDQECVTGLSCECGVCTRVCEASTDCDGLPGAVCDSESDAHSAACGASSTVALCLPAAQADAGGCEGDACEAAGDAGADASSDGDADAGSDAGDDASQVEPVDCEGPLTFPDLVLEQIVRAAIEKPAGDIVSADITALTDLNNEGMDGDVSSLQGVQCLTSLTSITINSGQITDLTPLAQLAGLRGVFITDTLVEDVSPLSGLSMAVEIALEGNRVRDVRPLQGLGSLDLLWLSGNPLDCALNADAITSLEDVGVDVDAPQCD